jgi:hypothetical protein
MPDQALELAGVGDRYSIELGDDSARLKPGASSTISTRPN